MAEEYNGPERRQVFCRRCGREQAQTNESCENCGARMVGPSRLLPVLLIVVLVASVASLITALVVVTRQQTTLDEVHRAAYDTRVTAFQSCQGANTARVALVQNFLLDAQDLRNDKQVYAERIALTAAAQTPSGIAVLHEAAADKTAAAHRKVQAAAKTVEAIRASAVTPNAKLPNGTPDYAARAVRDCEAVYPLPANSADALPQPTKP